MIQTDLVLQAQQGDPTAIHQLLGACHADVRRYAYRHCHASDIDDAVQETLLMIARKVRALRAAAAFSAWIFIVLRRQ